MPNQRSIRDFFAVSSRNPPPQPNPTSENVNQVRATESNITQEVSVLSVDTRSTQNNTRSVTIRHLLPEDQYRLEIIEMYQLRFQLEHLREIVEADRSNGVFGINYLGSYEWLFYHISRQRAECLYCTLNCPQDRTENRVTGVFKTACWNSQSTVYATHINSNKHLAGRAAYFQSYSELPSPTSNPTSRNLIQHSLANASRVSRSQEELNAEMLLRIHGIFILCMRQGLALRGTANESIQSILEAETPDEDLNHGNFLAILRIHYATSLSAKLCVRRG